MTDDLSARDVDGWDSLSHMVIISEIENHFGVKFKLRELNKLNNLGNLIELVSGKIDQK
jgi:acyl carrier protein